jgi:hypothetical protein
MPWFILSTNNLISCYLRLRLSLSNLLVILWWTIKFFWQITSLSILIVHVFESCLLVSNLIFSGLFLLTRLIKLSLLYIPLINLRLILIYQMSFPLLRLSTYSSVIIETFPISMRVLIMIASLLIPISSPSSIPSV